jgi:ParB-like chromosome segregation protein Spo0J
MANQKIKLEPNNQISDLGKNIILLKPEKIIKHPKISKLFAIQEKTVEKIITSMQKGYDYSQPVVVYAYNEKYILVDGHQRLEAAIKVGIPEIPAYAEEFHDLQDALQYAYRRQAERRNLTEWEILKAAELLPNKEAHDGTGRSIEKLSNDLGVSASTLVHARTVSKRANKEDKEAVKEGKKSINEIYQKVKTSKPKKQIADDEQKTTAPTTEDIIRLLVGNKETSAINLILSQYRNSLNTEFLSELGL